MADEQIIYLSPEEELTSVRERLEKTPARRIILVVPTQTQMRSHVSWRLLHSRARELAKEILVISSESQILAVAKAAGFKVAKSQGSPSMESHLGSRPSRADRLAHEKAEQTEAPRDMEKQVADERVAREQARRVEANRIAHEKADQVARDMAQQAQTIQAGRQLGNYRLMRLLGQGGFAQVYLGEHIYLETLTAIKVLFTQLAHDDIEHFRSEARTVAHLKHSHIIRVLEFGIDGTTPFLVMDYAANGTLRQRYPKGTCLPLSTIVSYVKQVASALQYAHDANVIHRDIKPENMLLGEQQEVLLSDFGIAVIAHSSRSDRTLDTTGTIAYMAPEQIQAHPRPASDQYALGIVVYEWLVGDRPFNGSFTEVAAKHLLAPPPLLREKIPTIPLEVEQVVLKALAKDPHQRFATVQAFANALEHAN